MRRNKENPAVEIFFVEVTSMKSFLDCVQSVGLSDMKPLNAEEGKQMFGSSIKN